jgi:ubiquinone/menaquinone biosynthesis C-methylase UbiE
MEFIYLIFFLTYVSIMVMGRKGLKRLKVIPADSGESDESFHFILHPDVSLSEEQKKSIVAFMRQHHIELLDLVPQVLSASRALDTGFFIQFSGDERFRFADGYSSGSGLVVSGQLKARYGEKLPDTLDYMELNHMAQRLKYYVPLTMESALLPGLKAPRRSKLEDYRILKLYFLDWQAILFSYWLIAAVLLALGPFSSSWLGLMAFAAYVGRTPVTLLGGQFKVTDLWLYTLLCIPLDILRCINLLYYSSVAALKPSEDYWAKKKWYDREIAEGVDRFFNPKRADCPVCGSTGIAPFLESGDAVQCKPGHFFLDECRDCGHIWQNPRLNSAGLDFYYRDFYSGFDQYRTEYAFKNSMDHYVARLKAVTSCHPRPRSWLDVGMGLGHFCNVARSFHPETRFEGLDLSDKVADVEKWGWVDKGYQGLFPEHAARLAGRYDVVSMSHYLEHTVDPKLEIAAASRVLMPGGFLMIEVPNPHSRISRFMGALAMPWFQPQHLNFLGRSNFERILGEHNFKVVQWDDVTSDIPVDFVSFFFLLSRRIAPPYHYPWSARSLQSIVWSYIVTMLFIPLMVLGLFIDQVRIRLLKGEEFSNSLRLVAQKVG